MRVTLGHLVATADITDPAQVAYLKLRKDELEKDLAEGGYTKKSYEAGDRRELRHIQNLLKKVT
jgi:hypothetical protein